ncbi:MAG: DNA-3-methyladenine glycosylase 2 family protein [Clostridia bacterium]|nr:DNA-3-methyladenine glycosylase 2 family protein [Clostridia bacterium]
MNKKSIMFKNVNPLDLSLTLDCGQSFRWSENDDGSWHGVVRGKSVDAYIDKNDLVICGDVSDNDVHMWKEYFDLGRNYASVCEKLKADKWLNKAICAYPGIRILKQDPWEALCSFIISQNNNIPRIKGIISRLCAEFGEDLGCGDFSFPPAEMIASQSAEALAPLRAGFRVKYILDAARRVAYGEIDFIKISEMPIEQAREELMKISGVGPKVAECALLYGLGRVDAFPVDVWVRRIMAELYPEGLPECADGVQGIAQQYLFHWRRNVENPFEK